MTPTLSEMELLARQAGVILRAGFRQNIEITAKTTSIDLVTEMDRRSEEFLIGSLQKHYPDHHFIAEESGVQGQDTAHIWYIDPLDGTVNYAHGIPIFAVSIAYIRDGQATLGVVYDPMQDECFSAERGRGAWLNGTPVKVASAPGLGSALLVTGFSYDIWNNPVNNLDHFARFSLRSQGVRRLGSAALDLSYVAAGRFDGYWELQVKPWDIAAGALIASEAGARVTTVNGDAEYLSGSPSIIAANPALHAELFSLLHAPQ